MEASSEQPTSRPKAKRTGKDSVFSDLFRIPHYQWKMVKALHPEWDLAEEEIRLLSLHSVLLNRPYNDLGLLVRNHLLILVEAQSTWSVNVLVRILLYLASTWHSYIKENKLYLYGAKAIRLPVPELYVIYTGKRKNCPETLSLAEEFFQGSSAIDLKVRVLTQPDPKNIIGQYIRFCHVFDEQASSLGLTSEAIEETIRICQNESILADYLQQRRQEVVTIMMTLFHDEELMDAYGEECRPSCPRWPQRGLFCGNSGTFSHPLSRQLSRTSRIPSAKPCLGSHLTCFRNFSASPRK